jgi:hypothetical protein
MQSLPVQTQRAGVQEEERKSRKGILEREQRRSVSQQITANANQQALEKRR